MRLLRMRVLVRVIVIMIMGVWCGCCSRTLFSLVSLFSNSWPSQIGLLAARPPLFFPNLPLFNCITKTCLFFQLLISEFLELFFLLSEHVDLRNNILLNILTLVLILQLFKVLGLSFVEDAQPTLHTHVVTVFRRVQNGLVVLIRSFRVIFMRVPHFQLLQGWFSFSECPCFPSFQIVAHRFELSLIRRCQWRSRGI